MIDLVAFSPGDGWGVLCDGGAWWLFQPPYESGSRSPLPPAAAARLLLDDFGPFDRRSFSDWGEAARWMSAERLKHAKSQGPLPSPEDAARIFDFAGDDEILTHFATVASWIREGDRAAARRAVTAIMLSPKVRGAAVRNEAQRLLRLAEERRPPRFRASAGYGVKDEDRLAEEIDVVHTRGVLSFAPQDRAA